MHSLTSDRNSTPELQLQPSLAAHPTERPSPPLLRLLQLLIQREVCTRVEFHPPPSTATAATCPHLALALYSQRRSIPPQLEDTGSAALVFRRNSIASKLCTFFAKRYGHRLALQVLPLTTYYLLLTTYYLLLTTHYLLLRYGHRLALQVVVVVVRDMTTAWRCRSTARRHPPTQSTPLSPASPLPPPPPTSRPPLTYNHPRHQQHHTHTHGHTHAHARIHNPWLG